ncbi:hypothetical protein SEA_ZUKO_79 [Streptomyces phage Zuko]|uniref:Uncharacterized protein n=1 Tax=Streptomyces phage Zuko TaxID=2601695 RepID=A0A5J6D768_9CAUD|nr:hypothetical protein PP630_gp079 [Streptomyces phage Zuko]QEQ93657.1 hypothetical protein SEA_ZUKO_79 [Streptomyces phage Zuko]
MTEYDPRMSLKHNPQPKMERGLYLANIESVDATTSSSGTPMARFRFRLSHSPMEGLPYTYLWRVPLVATDIQKLTQVNRALGLPTPSLPRLLSGEDKLDTSLYLGNPALIHLKPEIYQGKWRSIITEVRPTSQAIALKAITHTFGEDIEL